MTVVANNFIFKIVILLFTSFIFSVSHAQVYKNEVLTLGTFHFNFPNRDVKKISTQDQIDVLEPKYQKEIEDIVSKIAQFKPTIIAIEREPDKQNRYDSLLNMYIKGDYKLRRNEEEQIGFRLAKLLKINKLYCIDSNARYYQDSNDMLEKKDSLENIRFTKFFYKNPDSLKSVSVKHIFKSQGILAQLKMMNSKESIKNDFGSYLIGVFKYETEKNKYFGPDFTSGWVFDRNLRIFRNIQRIPKNESDKILIIYGAGHLGFLNLFIDSSPEYRLVNAQKFLE